MLLSMLLLSSSTLLALMPLATEASAGLADVSSDLVVSELTADPASPTERDTVRLQAVVTNQGDDAAGSFRVSFQIDNVAFLGSREVLLLGPGESVTLVSDAWTATPGSHTIRAAADAGSSVAESDETNNVLAATLAVAELILPDYSIGSFSTVPHPPHQNEEFQLEAIIHNTGRTAGNLTVAFLLGGVEVGRVDVLDVPPGGSGTARFAPWSGNAGSHALRLIADPDGVFAELDESNNELLGTLTILPPPRSDVVVKEIRVTPATPVEGEAVTFEAVVLNQGELTAEQVLVLLELDGETLARAELPTLDSGATATLPVTWTAILGSHTLTAVANTTLAEQDHAGEAGNTRARTISVSAPPPPPPADLVLDAIDILPANPAADDPITINATIRNAGGTAAANFTVKFLLDDSTLLGEARVEGIAPSKTLVLPMAWNATEGSHTVSVVVDSGSEVSESAESNNDDSQAFGVSERTRPKLPDLAIANVTLDPAQPSPGDTVKFVAEVVNQGEALAGAFTVRFLLNGNEMTGDGSVLLLGAGDRAVVTSGEWTAESGVHTLQAIADPANLIEEAQESNNGRATTIRAGAWPTALSPDLVLLGIATSPETPAANQSTRFRATVQNQGDGPSSSFTVRFFVDGSLVGDSPVLVLASGELAVVESLPWSGPDGHHLVEVQVDPENLVLETIESNNAGSQRFYAFLPDLTVTTLEPSATPVRNGDATTFLATVLNQNQTATFNSSLSDDFEIYGEWAPQTTGGSGFYWSSGADYTKERAHSGTMSTKLWFSTWYYWGDYGTRSLEREFPLERIDEISTRFYVDRYSGGRSYYDNMDAGIRLIPLDADGQPTGRTFTYWLSEWYRWGGKEPGKDTIEVHHQPPMHQWVPFTAKPTRDFDYDWAGVQSVRVQLYVSVSGAYGNHYRIFFDDVELSTSQEFEGAAPATESVARFDIEGVVLSEASVPPLGAGESATIESSQWSATSGDHWVTTSVDTGGAVQEGDELNNQATKLQHVVAPDLVVVNVSWVADDLYPGDEVTFHATVKNIGGVANASTLRIAIAGTTLGEAAIPTLAYGETASVALSGWTAVGGDHALHTTADALGAVAEESEANNVLVANVHVHQPDLTITDVSITPANPAQGDAVTLLARVKNAGVVDAGASTIRFLLDGTTSLGDIAVPALSAGATIDITGPTWTTLGGFHELAGVADVLAAVSEENEINNQLTVERFVRQPDLVVQSIAAADAAHGDSVSFAVTVANLDYGKPQRTIHQDDFEASGAWTKASGGGSSFLQRSFATPTTLHSVSDSTSLTLGFNGGSSGTDWGQILLARDFPLSRVDELQAKFLVDRYYHDRTWWDGLGSFVQLVPLDGSGAPLGRHYTYVLSAWWKSSDTISVGSDTVLVYGKPPLNQWLDLDVRPTNDFGIDWSGVASVRVQLVVSAGGMRSDNYRIFYDDLRLVGLGEGSESGSAVAQETEVRVKVDGLDLGSVAVPALAPGESTTVMTPAWTATGGDHVVSAAADHLGTLHEFREGNNARQSEYHVRQVDLVVQALAATPGTPEQGQATTLTATLANLGDAGAVDSLVRFTLDGVTELATVAVPALAAGATAQVTAPSWSATGGSHTITATADAGATLEEISESNNARDLTIRVRQPDLRVAALVLWPDDPEDREPVTINATIQNQGDGVAGATVVRFILDGSTILGEADVAALAAGESAIVSSPAWTSIGGAHAVEAVADATGALVEIVEDNNAGQISFFVRQPDVRIAEVGPSGGSPIHGDATTFVANVTNPLSTIVATTLVQEDFESGQDWSFERSGGRSFLSGAKAELSTIRATSGTQSARLSFYGGSGDGSDYGSLAAKRTFEARSLEEISLRFFVDDYYHRGSSWDGMWTIVRVTGLDSSGAAVTANYDYWLAHWHKYGTIQPWLDTQKLVYTKPPLDTWLTFTGRPSEDFAIDWSGVEQVQVTLLVYGGGTFHSDRLTVYFDDLRATSSTITRASATARDFNVRFLLDGQTALGDVTVASLAPGDHALVTSPAWTAVGGNHTITAIVDVGDALAERNETNNVHSAAFRVRQADVEVTNLTQSPSPTHAGDKVTFHATVRNSGDAPASEFSLRFVLNPGTAPETMGEVTVPGLEPGESTTVTSSSWTARPGSYVVEATADVLAQVEEILETNNALQHSFGVEPVPDLTASDVQVGPTDPARAGQETVFTANVTNLGEAAAGSFIVAFLVDGATVSTVEVAGVSPGQTLQVQSPPWTATLGLHRVTVVVDSTGVVRESNETNNEVARDFTATL